MQICDFAKRILDTEALDVKLTPPPRDLSDEDRGPTIIYFEAARSEEHRILKRGRVKVPGPLGMRDPSQRARILHALANHELQAVELFAWALLAFPDTPEKFRRGMLAIIKEEQSHFRLYEDRIQALGHRFGDFPVSGYFWNKLPRTVTTPIEFVCTMGLTLENANLDHAAALREQATLAGDHETAQALDVVHREEIRHVRFGWRWLQRFSAQDSDLWQQCWQNVQWPLGPSRARGQAFDRNARIDAGISTDFIDRLEATPPEAPGGASR